MSQFFSSYGDLLIIAATVVGFLWLGVSGIAADDVAYVMGTFVGAINEPVF